MRRLVVVALLLIVSSQAQAGVLDRIRQSGAFKIGYRADANPYSYRTENGQPAGYVVDLCREVAAAVSVEVGTSVRSDYIQVPADQRFEAVKDGRIDILCDPSSVTVARREIVDFSLPTFVDGAGMLSRSSNPLGSYIDLTNRRVGVLGGTTTEEVLRQALAELRINTTVVPVPDHRTGMDLLARDKLDAYFADRGIIAAVLYEGGRPGFQLAKPYFSTETYALALPRDDSAFRFLVDRTLARVYRSGKVQDLLAKAFGKTPQDEILRTMILINALPEK